ncbi:MAG: hypothetical protein Q8L48_10870 [Archangium sp.]|nr:hypothetical protein [Archangium sp.]
MRLELIKALHTVVWAVLAGGILAIAPLAIAGHFGVVLGITIAVLLETVVLAVNGWRCPLTPWAARYTEDRAPNFDIYLPRWLAQHNKTIFTGLFVAGEVVAFVAWRGWL